MANSDSEPGGSPAAADAVSEQAARLVTEVTETPDTPRERRRLAAGLEATAA